MRFLSEWLKYQVRFFARAYIPAIAIFMFAVKFFPSFTMEATGIFAVVVFIVIFVTAKPTK